MFDPWLRKIPGEGNGNPPQDSRLENPMDGGAWQATVNGSQRVGHHLVTEQQQQNRSIYCVIKVSRNIN